MMTSDQAARELALVSLVRTVALSLARLDPAGPKAGIEKFSQAAINGLDFLTREGAGPELNDQAKKIIRDWFDASGLPDGPIP